MAPVSLEARIARVVAGTEPGAWVGRIWPLLGGMSAEMTALEVTRTDGTRVPMVARIPNGEKSDENPGVAEEEFRLLTILKTRGIPVPTPIALEPRSEEIPRPFLVVEYIAGRPELTADDPIAYAHRFAERLVEIHAVDLSGGEFDFLPRQGLGYVRRERPVNVSMREGEILDALESIGRVEPSDQPVLLHGDFWPGNVLWGGPGNVSGGTREIVGVIDWEEARIGDPLVDVAICRLDLLWLFGRRASDAFTARYAALTGRTLERLPYWDLCAALRPTGNLEEWVPAYAHLGRSDVTEATMLRGHREFVARALSALAR